MSIKPFVKQSGNGPALALLHGWGLHGGIHRRNHDAEIGFGDYPVFQ